MLFAVILNPVRKQGLHLHDELVEIGVVTVGQFRADVLEGDARVLDGRVVALSLGRLWILVALSEYDRTGIVVDHAERSPGDAHPSLQWFFIVLLVDLELALQHLQVGGVDPDQAFLRGNILLIVLVAEGTGLDRHVHQLGRLSLQRYSTLLHFGQRARLREVRKGHELIEVVLTNQHLLARFLDRRHF